MLVNEINSKELICENKAIKISDEAKDLLMKLLEKNPSQRISCENALNHHWIQ
jgi:serine/threonine protein kinase